jgi:hypothetical protein
MHRLKALAVTAISSGAVLISVSVANALPPVPPGDAYLYQGQAKTPVGESDNNIFIPTTAADGTGVTLYEIGPPGQQVPSDYIYAFSGFIYFSSDPESGPPNLIHGDTSKFKPLRETGDWQQVDTLLGVASPFYVASDIPEPATWAMMLAGLFGVGAMVRRGRSKGAPANA